MNNQPPTARDVVTKLHPYEPGMSTAMLRRTYGIQGEIIKLASNENPHGTSPLVAERLRNHETETASRYPDMHELVQAIADKHGVDPACVVIGNGSNDVLDIVSRAYLEPGVQTISSQYAFVVYGLVASLSGAEHIVVPAQKFGHDLHAIVQAITLQTKVIWIANPNNPTGTFLSGEQIHSFMKQVPPEVIVVLDEAYSDYLQPDDRYDSISWLGTFSNLIIVRTLSKIYGLAGLRIGYALTHPLSADYMNRVRQPFNVNNLAIMAAITAIKDFEYVSLSYERNLAGIKALTEGLNGLRLRLLPSHGNFVTVAFDNAANVHIKLLKQGIIVRPLASYGMVDYLRISVGTENENQKLLAALASIMNE